MWLDTAQFSVAAEPVDSPPGQALLRAYVTELVARYHGRPATPAEVASVLGADPGAGLRPPDGRFLVLRWDDRPAGMVGLRPLGSDTAEIKRLYVLPAARRRGAGRRLLDAAERAATDLGRTRLRLDTRGDLVEARALYAAAGYAEIRAYNDDPYAEHWFEKRLAPD